jgi:hypothetical protein
MSNVLRETMRIPCAFHAHPNVALCIRMWLLANVAVECGSLESSRNYLQYSFDFTELEIEERRLPTLIKWDETSIADSPKPGKEMIEETTSWLKNARKFYDLGEFLSKPLCAIVTTDKPWDFPVIKYDQFEGRTANYIDYEDLILDIARLPSLEPPKVSENAWNTQWENNTSWDTQDGDNTTGAITGATETPWDPNEGAQNLADFL